MHSLKIEEIPFTTNLSANATYGSLADLQNCTRNNCHTTLSFSFQLSLS